MILIQCNILTLASPANAGVHWAVALLRDDPEQHAEEGPAQPGAEVLPAGRRPRGRGARAQQHQGGGAPLLPRHREDNCQGKQFLLE